MSRPTTPPEGLASGAQCLPAGAWSTKRQTTPHARRPPPPPPRPKGTPAARTPHTQARRYLPPACATAGFGGCQQSGMAWDSDSREQRPGAPKPVESRRYSCGDRGPGRPGEALTQTKPTPPPPPLARVCSGLGLG